MAQTKSVDNICKIQKLATELRELEEHLVEYALSRSMSPALIAEYKLHLPDKHILERKLREQSAGLFTVAATYKPGKLTYRHNQVKPDIFNG